MSVGNWGHLFSLTERTLPVSFFSVVYVYPDMTSIKLCGVKNNNVMMIHPSSTTCCTVIPYTIDDIIICMMITQKAMKGRKRKKNCALCEARTHDLWISHPEDASHSVLYETNALPTEPRKLWCLMVALRIPYKS